MQRKQFEEKTWKTNLANYNSTYLRAFGLKGSFMALPLKVFLVKKYA